MDVELKTKTETIIELNKALTEAKAEQRVDETKVTSKDKELQDKREQISKLEKSLETVTGKLLTTNEEHQKTATTQQRNIESKLLTQTDSLNKKDLAIQQLRSNLEHVEKELTKTQNREQEISSKEAELRERETKIKGREFEMNSTESKLRDREINVKIREDNMDLTERGLRESEDDVKRREEQLNSRDSRLRIQANNIKKQEDELHPKEIKLAEREAEIKKREDEVNPKETRLAAREAETKKQLLCLERKTRRFRLDQMDSKDPIRVNCRIITSRTREDALVATVEKGGQAKVTAGNKWYFSSKDAKFHTVYPINTKPEDICQSIADLVEHAIDGKMSCLIAHDVSRRENWTTMFGPEGASDALVPYAIATIFRRTKELTQLGYQVDVTAIFTTPSIPSTISESFKKVEIANEQTALELLKKGTIDQVDGATDHFVQFFINTTIEQETRTGTLVLGTFSSMKIIKECFRSVEPTTQLTKHISAMTSDGRCRSALITHIHEDRVDETKNCLAMVNEITKMNKK